LRPMTPSSRRRCCGSCSSHFCNRLGSDASTAVRLDASQTLCLPDIICPAPMLHDGFQVQFRQRRQADVRSIGRPARWKVVVYPMFAWGPLGIGINVDAPPIEGGHAQQAIRRIDRDDRDVLCAAPPPSTGLFRFGACSVCW
jgi:hypothetical protein